MAFVQSPLFGTAAAGEFRPASGVATAFGHSVFESVLLQILASSVSPTQSSPLPAFALPSLEGHAPITADSPAPEGFAGFFLETPARLRTEAAATPPRTGTPTPEDDGSAGALALVRRIAAARSESATAAQAMEFVTSAPDPAWVGAPVLDLSEGAFALVALTATGPAADDADQSNPSEFLDPSNAADSSGHAVAPTAIRMVPETLAAVFAELGLEVIPPAAATRAESPRASAESAGQPLPSDGAGLLRLTDAHASPESWIVRLESLVRDDRGNVFIPAAIRTPIAADGRPAADQPVMFRLLASPIAAPAISGAAGSTDAPAVVHPDHSGADATATTAPPIRPGNAVAAAGVPASTTAPVPVRLAMANAATTGPAAEPADPAGLSGASHIPPRTASSPPVLAPAGNAPADDARARGLSLRDLINALPADRNASVRIESIRIESVRIDNARVESSGSRTPSPAVPGSAITPATAPANGTSPSASGASGTAAAPAAQPAPSLPEAAPRNATVAPAPAASGSATTIAPANGAASAPVPPADPPKLSSPPALATAPAAAESASASPRESIAPRGGQPTIDHNTRANSPANPAPQARSEIPAVSAAPRATPPMAVPAPATAATPEASAPQSTPLPQPGASPRTEIPSSVDAPPRMADDAVRSAVDLRPALVVTIGTPRGNSEPKESAPARPASALTSPSLTAAALATPPPPLNQTAAQRPVVSAAVPTAATEPPMATAVDDAHSMTRTAPAPGSTASTLTPIRATAGEIAEPRERTAALPTEPIRSHAPAATNTIAAPATVSRPEAPLTTDPGPSAESTTAWLARNGATAAAGSREDRTVLTETLPSRNSNPVPAAATSGAPEVEMRRPAGDAVSEVAVPEPEATVRDRRRAFADPLAPSIASARETNPDRTDAANRRGFVAEPPARESADSRADVGAAARQAFLEAGRGESNRSPVWPVRSADRPTSAGGRDRTIAETRQNHNESGRPSNVAESRPEGPQPVERTAAPESAGGVRELTPVVREARAEAPAPLASAGSPAAGEVRESIATARTAPEPAWASPVDEEDVAQQIVRHAKLELSRGRSEIQVRLAPESLGTVRVRIAIEDGHVAARVVAEHLETHRLLERSIHHLRTALEHSGLQVDRIEVTPPSAGERTNLSQHAHQERGGETHRDAQQQPHHRQPDHGGRGGHPAHRDSAAPERRRYASWGHDYTA